MEVNFSHILRQPLHFRVIFDPQATTSNPNSNELVDDYCCAKFYVIPIRGFRFIVLTPTHIRVVGADNNDYKMNISRALLTTVGKKRLVRNILNVIATAKVPMNSITDSRKTSGTAFVILVS